MTIRCVALFAFFALVSSWALADDITTYSSRPLFEAVAGPPLTVEDFTSGAHFPIPSGVLNSATNLVPDFGTPILPGDIEPGVTYSTPAAGRSGNFFTIDSSGGFEGGFLDGISESGFNATLTATFDAPVWAFGFDTNFLMGPTFDVRILFSSGPDYVHTFNVANSIAMEFFGFISDQQDIVAAQITSTHELYDFPLDNFTFGGAIPEPSSLLLVAMGGVVVGASVRRRSR